MANKPNNPSLWSRAKSLAKQKFDVYPSAYANGWAAKYYKSKGGTWRKGEMGMEVMNTMRSGGINNPGFKSLPGYVQAKIKSNMQTGGMTGFTPQTSAGNEVLKNAIAMTYMKDGGKMPSEIARARFMAAAGGNESEAKSMGTKYGYKFQNAGVKRPPASMRAAIAEGRQRAQRRRNPEVLQRVALLKSEVAKKNEALRQKAIAGQQRRQAEENRQEIAAMKARIDESVAAQNKPFSASQLRTETQATGDKLRLFGPSSPLVGLGLVEADANSFIDNYLNPGVFIGDMASSLGSGIADAMETGNYTNLAKGIAAPLVAGATMGVLKGPLHTLEKKIAIKTNNVVGNAFGNTNISAAVPATLAIRGVVNTGAKTGIKAAEHDVVHKTISPITAKASTSSSSSSAPVFQKFENMTPEQRQKAVIKYGNPSTWGMQGVDISTLKKGGIKEMYYMKKGGQFPDRYKKMGFSGVNQPKRTPGSSKSHAVVTKVGGDYKLIRFGQQGVSGSPKKAGESASYAARRRSFKARHAKNIAKGKSSAAWWANKIKWILAIPFLSCQLF